MYECLCGFTCGTERAFNKHRDAMNQQGAGWHAQKRRNLGTSHYVYSFPDSERAHKIRTPLRPESKASLNTPNAHRGQAPAGDGGLLDTINGLAETHEAERFLHPHPNPNPIRRGLHHLYPSIHIIRPSLIQTFNSESSESQV